MTYTPQPLTPNTLARAEDINGELMAIKAEFDATEDRLGAVFAPYRGSFAEAIEAFAPGAYFSTNATGALRVYQRVAAAPGYIDMGDSAAPFTAASAQEALATLRLQWLGDLETRAFFLASTM